MSRTQESYRKKNLRQKKDKKRKEKEEKRQARKDSGKRSGLEEMIAYVDENGVIRSTPPEKTKEEEINPEDIEI